MGDSNFFNYYLLVILLVDVGDNSDYPTEDWTIYIFKGFLFDLTGVAYLNG